MANRKILHLLQLDPTLQCLSHISSHELHRLIHIPLPLASTILQQIQRMNVPRLIEDYAKRNIRLITILDPLYPSYLKHISNAPAVLFCKGNVSLLQHKRNISVVGARKATEYGIKLVSSFIRPLVREKWLIVSGLAKGIDSLAHKAAIEENGKTIAVIAGGFNHIYPKEHQQLSDIITKQHLLISIYPPERRPEKWMFPERNQIISGLSLGTFVVQAAKKSGSLITAQYALEEGREVFTVPASIFAEEFAGNINLIRDGATIISSYKDIVNGLLPMMED
jgi:DNA processing protein